MEITKKAIHLGLRQKRDPRRGITLVADPGNLRLAPADNFSLSD